MTRSISYCALIAALTVMIVCTIMRPDLLGDKNTFLAHFVNQELLALLGIIMTITLASAANLHLEFNKIEERYKRRGLTKTRHGVRQGTYCLIWLFSISILIVVLKPILADTPAWQSAFNGIALVVLLCSAGEIRIAIGKTPYRKESPFLARTVRKRVETIHRGATLAATLALLLFLFEFKFRHEALSCLVGRI
jgi:hypothetical protein